MKTLRCLKGKGADRNAISRVRVRDEHAPPQNSKATVTEFNNKNNALDGNNNAQRNRHYSNMLVVRLDLGLKQIE